MKRAVPVVVAAGQAVVIAVPLYYWLGRMGWSFSGLTVLKLFPLLGLVAFSMMWFHFFVGSLKRLWPDAMDYRRFFRVTGNVVLVLILLHPGLLFYKSLTTNFKLNVFNYVSDRNEVFVLFAFTALTGFLLYEIADRTRERPWVIRNWPYIKAMNLSAFILIFWHGLMLGQHLQAGWLRGVWVFYGISTLLFIVHGYWYDVKQQAAAHDKPTR